MPRPAADRFLDGSFLAILVCFILSGFAGLLYETAWTREFAFVFGTSELAIATVLAGYFGGLSLGAALAARLLSRIRRPVLTYGLLEFGIAICAFAMPSAILACTRVYVAWFGGDRGGSMTDAAATAGFYLAASFLVMLVPTALMGATLPLLARYAVKEDRQIGPRIGLLYAANTLGAVAGTLTTAFALLPALGLRETVWVGAGVNLLVFLIAAILSAKAGTLPATKEALTDAVAVGPRVAPRARQFILWLMLLSGAASFAYEVLWTRILGHVLGGSVLAFATMLAAFLAGIAVGAGASSRWIKSPAGAGRGFAWAQVGTACFSLASYALVESVPRLAGSIGAGAGGSLFANVAVSVLILFPGACCMGATFPLAVRVAAQSERDAGTASARVYVWNTVGAILGSVGTGFLLLPALGFAGTLMAAVGLNLAIAVVTCIEAGSRKFAGLAVGIVLVVLLLVRPAEPWEVLRASALGGLPGGGSVAYYGVGRAATVLLVDDGLGWDLRTNGLPEAHIRRAGVPLGRERIQQWQSALPVLARPNAESMLCVGLGGGVSVESVPSCIRQIDVIELESEVVEANRKIGDLRAINPLADPRVRVLTNDARNALLLATDRYDIVISQPSHPWTAGASHLYTREFMLRVLDRLTPDGVFVQWMAMNLVDESLLRSLTGTMWTVFKYVEVYSPYPGAVLLIGSPSPLRVWETAPAALSARPTDFEAAGIVASEDVLAALLLDDPASHRFGDGAALLTDDRNALQFSFRRRGDQATASWRHTDAYLALDDPAASADCDRGYLVQRLLTTGNVARAQRVASGEQRAAENRMLLGLIRAWEGANTAAAELFREALAEDSQSREARYGWVRVRADQYLQGDRETVEQTLLAASVERAVFDGWRLSASRSWNELRALEPPLSQAAPTESWYADAIRLRSKWRILIGDSHLALEGAELLNKFVHRSGTPEDFFQRAEGYLKAGRALAALASVEEAARLLPRGDRGAALARSALTFLEKIPPETRQCEAGRRTRERLLIASGRAR